MSFGLEECRNSELENRLTSYTVYTHALGHTEHPEVLYSFFHVPPWVSVFCITSFEGTNEGNLICMRK